MTPVLHHRRAALRTGRDQGGGERWQQDSSNQHPPRTCTRPQATGDDDVVEHRELPQRVGGAAW